MRRVFNFRAFLVVLVALVILGVGGYFLHRYQMSRQDRIFLEKADQAEADKNPAAAANFLERYILMRPKDAKVKGRYVLLLDQSAKSHPEQVRAYLAIEKVLREEPSPDSLTQQEREDLAATRQALHKRAALRANKLNKHQDALEHLKPLLAASPRDVDLKELQAEAEKGLARKLNAQAIHREIIELAPDRVDSYVELMSYAAGDGNFAAAEGWAKQMVEANPRSAEARLKRSNFLRGRRRFDEAAQDLDIARGLSADEETRANVLLASAELAYDRAGIASSSRRKADADKLYAEADRFHADGMNQFPKDARFLLGAAQIALSRGVEGRPAALAALNKALSLVGEGTYEQWLVTKLFLDAGDKKQAEALCTAFRNKYGALPVIEYIRARLLYEEERYGDAVTIQERIRESIERYPQIALESDLILAKAHHKLKNHDRRLAALDRLLSRSPETVELQFARAEALHEVNRDTEAIAIYRRYAKERPLARFQLARLLMAIELKKPDKDRDWKDITTLLESLPADMKQSREFQLLNFQMLWSSNRIKELEETLDRACRDSPKEGAFWAVKCGFLEWRLAKDPDARAREVEKCLAEAERTAGDHVALRVARLRTLAGAAKEKALAVLTTLQQGTEKFNPEERASLYTALSDAYRDLGMKAKAKELLYLAADAVSLDISILGRLVELHVYDGEYQKADELIARMRQKEGEDGVNWRLSQLQECLVKLDTGDQKALGIALKTADELEKLQPNMPRAQTAQGLLFFHQGLKELALEKLLRAIELGERNPSVVKKAVDILLDFRRTDEARQLVAKNLADLQGTAFYAKLASEVAVLARDEAANPAQTLEMAKRAVSANSANYRDQLWLATIHASMNDPKGAEPAYRKAIQLAPEEPVTWTEWITFLVKAGRKDEAEAEAKRAGEALKDKVPYVLAPYYEALGQVDQAEEQWLKIAAKPDDPANLQTLAMFYLRVGNGAKAEPILKKLADMTGVNASAIAWARRSYALILAVKGDYASFRQAKTLLERNLRDNPTSPEDLRIRALVQSSRPGPRRDSIKDLETSFVRLRPNPNEAILLARLYEEDGEWEKASLILEEQMRGRGAEIPYCLAYYIRALIRHGQPDKAVPWMDKLEAKAPRELPTMEARARLLFAQGKKKEGVQLVESRSAELFAEQKNPLIFLQASNFFEEMREIASAETAVRRYVTEARAKNPKAIFALMEFLSRNSRSSEAIQQIEESWDKLPAPEAAQAAVAAYIMGSAKDEDFRRLEARLSTVAQQYPTDVRIPMALADMYSIKGRSSEAIEIYRKVLLKDPANPVALNNLAWLLSESTVTVSEALDYINRAINQFGPAGSLLDTRAMILMRKQRYAEAVTDMNEAISQNPKASYYMHLALIQHHGKNASEARRAWDKAVSLRLDPEKLTFSERTMYNELAGHYKR